MLKKITIIGLFTQEKTLRNETKLNECNRKPDPATTNEIIVKLYSSILPQLNYY